MDRAEGEVVVDVSRDVVSLPDPSSDPVAVLDRIPQGAGWRYEPDWDGLRVVVHHRHGVELRSDRNRPLGRYFPEVERTVEALPSGSSARGTLVVIRPDGFSYDLLRRRINPSASHVSRVSTAWPATLVLTDVAPLATRPRVRARTLKERRADLLAFGQRAGVPSAPGKLRGLSPGEPVFITPQSDLMRFAQRWLDDVDQTGRDGVIARNTDGQTMARIPRSKTAMCVVIGVHPSDTGAGEAPQALILGLFDGNELVPVGRTSASRTAKARRDVLEYALSVPSIGEQMPPTGDPYDVPARVCEVTFHHLRGRRFRHAVAFERWLPGVDPRACTMAQFTDLSGHLARLH